MIQTSLDITVSWKIAVDALTEIYETVHPSPPLPGHHNLLLRCSVYGDIKCTVDFAYFLCFVYFRCFVCLRWFASLSCWRCMACLTTFTCFLSLNAFSSTNFFSCSNRNFSTYGKAPSCLIQTHANHNPPIRSVEGLTLVTSTSLSLHDGNSHAVRHASKNSFQIIVIGRWPCMGDKLPCITFSCLRCLFSLLRYM